MARPKVEVRSAARFDPGFPDDRIETDAYFLEFPGRNICEAIADKFRQMQVRVDCLRNAGEHGWELDLSVGDRAFWLQISWIDEDCCILQFEEAPVLFRRKRFDDPVYWRFLRALHDALAKDGRFRNLRWFVRGDEDVVDGVGKPTPLDDSVPAL
ncbi:MAG TPA: hypothetical protein VG939_07255 [Caulobacteraceae bacterium]|nr:hypothetical protein [Caulobacteraceae bacterium]